MTSIPPSIKVRRHGVSDVAHGWYNPLDGRFVDTDACLYNDHYKDGIKIHFGAVLNNPEEFNVSINDIKRYARTMDKNGVAYLVDEFFDSKRDRYEISTSERSEYLSLRSLIFDYCVIELGWVRCSHFYHREDNCNDIHIECRDKNHAIKCLKDRFISDLGNDYTVYIDFRTSSRYNRTGKVSFGSVPDYEGNYGSVVLEGMNEVEDFINGIKRTKIGDTMRRFR